MSGGASEGGVRREDGARGVVTCAAEVPCPHVRRPGRRALLRALPSRPCSQPAAAAPLRTCAPPPARAPSSAPCREIHPRMPQFPPAEPNGKPVDFRRMLLNKCQQEFEEGTRAMAKVKAREQQQEAKDKQVRGRGGGGRMRRAGTAVRQSVRAGLGSVKWWQRRQVTKGQAGPGTKGGGGEGRGRSRYSGQPKRASRSRLAVDGCRGCAFKGLARVPACLHVCAPSG